MANGWGGKRAGAGRRKGTGSSTIGASNQGVRIDKSQVIGMFNDLTYGMNDIMFKGIKAGADTLVRLTKQNLQASDFKVSNKMLDGVRSTEYPQMVMCRVSIMKHPLLHIFEQGTKVRVTKGGKKSKSAAQRKVERIVGHEVTTMSAPSSNTKAGLNRGRITPKKFFERARQQESVIQNAIIAAIDKEIKK